MNELLTLDNPILLLLGLNALGLALKKSPIDNRWIPLLLSVVGCGVYPLLASPTPRNFLIGFIIGAGSVGFHQIVKQKTNENIT